MGGAKPAEGPAAGFKSLDRGGSRARNSGVRRRERGRGSLEPRRTVRSAGRGVGWTALARGRRPRSRPRPSGEVGVSEASSAEV